MSFANIFREKNRVLRVAELNSALRELIEANVPLLWVRGEISNLVKAASGHWYFSLKDDQAQVRCVMFRHKNQLLQHAIANGLEVEVLAMAGLYEARGDFQLTVEQMRPAGLGALYEQFERLKQKLATEGLFDAQRKRVLPRYPRRIGVVTSPQAAALRDVLTTLKLRLPGVPVVLYPTAVQGQGSAEKVAQAIALANQRAECDVLIVCRGGGSLEDLWAFNEEAVARAIAASALPIVTGIGHETDFTIADFVADERAPTPTAAAQRVVPDCHALRANLQDIAQHLQRAMRNRLQISMQTVDYLQRRVIHPAQQLHRQTQTLHATHQRLQRAFAYRVQHQNWQWTAMAQRLNSSSLQWRQYRQHHASLAQRLARSMRELQAKQNVRVEQVAQHLLLLDPQQVLARGYSLVRNEQGDLVTNADVLRRGENVHLTFARGWANAELKDMGGNS